MQRLVTIRRRFALAYAVLACAAAGAGAVTLRADLSGAHRQAVDPRAIAVVTSFLDALTTGDKPKACRLFDALPGCAQKNGTVFAASYRILRPELGTDEVFVPVLIDGQYAMIAVEETHGRFRIDDIVADPSVDVMPPFAA
jgi:hypothetical protein